MSEQCWPASFSLLQRAFLYQGRGVTSMTALAAYPLVGVAAAHRHARAWARTASERRRRRSRWGPATSTALSSLAGGRLPPAGALPNQHGERR